MVVKVVEEVEECCGRWRGNPIWILEREDDDEVETFETAAERQVNTLNATLINFFSKEAEARYVALASEASGATSSVTSFSCKQTGYDVKQFFQEWRTSKIERTNVECDAPFVEFGCTWKKMHSCSMSLHLLVDTGAWMSIMFMEAVKELGLICTWLKDQKATKQQPLAL